ncbi:MAG: hypothetical protein H5U37_02610 [Caldisericia bacterium]|nr:hypothetical protein [Caldisericia bacterium]
MEIKIDRDDEKRILAAISYIPLLFIIPLVLVKDDQFVHSHAKQGFVLFIVEVIIWVLGHIPLIGWVFRYIIGVIIFLVALYAFIEALVGKFWKIPIIGDISEEFKI